MTLLSIQYLRAVAALMVVLFHGLNQLVRLGPDWAGGGEFLASGVDIFFVVSGFIMWVTTSARNPGTLGFYRNRLARIAPLYWLMTTVMVMAMLEIPSLLQIGRFDLGHVVASYVFIPAAHPVVKDVTLLFPVMTVGWSINFEMFFYLLFGLTLVLPKRSRAITTVATLLALLLSPLILHPADGSVLKFYSSGFNLEFAAGVAIGYIFAETDFRPAPWLALAALIAGFALLPLGHWLFRPEEAATRLLFDGCAAAMIVGGAALYEKQRQIPRLLIPKALGDASYSLYLTHPLTLAALTIVWKKLLPSPNTGMAVAFLALALALASTVGYAVYLFVERPLTNAVRPKKRSADHRLGEVGNAPIQGVLPR